MAVKNSDAAGHFVHPVYQALESVPGLAVATAALDDLLSWGLTSSLWVFPMATSCCGIELMATAASRVDVDRMGTIVRGSPRQADVMVVAGTITTKMAPRVLKLWQQMPEPKWCIAMGSCAMTGDFYRNLYSVVPGVDTFMPVDVYVPGCPPNPEALMHGLLRLKERVQRQRRGETVAPEVNPGLISITRPSIPRLVDPGRPAGLTAAQVEASRSPTVAEQRPPVVVPARVDEGVDAAAYVEAARAAPGLAGPVVVPVAAHVEVARALKAAGYRQYVSCVATHFPAGTSRAGKEPSAAEHLEVVTVLRTVGKDSVVASWAVKVAVDEPVPTLYPLFAGADWQEREQFDLLGVRFAGHPDLRRLMMAENYEGHPLRRDFASDAPQAPWR